MARLATALVLVLVVAGAEVATADEPATFDDLAADSERVPDADAARELLWAARETCRGTPGSLDRIQCEALRARAMTHLSTTVFRIDVSGTARLAAFDKKRRSAVIQVHGCVGCQGTPTLVAGTGRVVRDGQIVLGPVIHSRTKVFRDRAEHVSLQAVIARSRTEVLFRVGRATGASVTLERVGFRTYDPCDGKVLAAEPSSEDRSPNARHCSKKQK